MVQEHSRRNALREKKVHRLGTRALLAMHAASDTQTLGAARASSKSLPGSELAWKALEGDGSVPQTLSACKFGRFRLVDIS